ncbi:MAG: hypothetical protein Q9192_006499, partial [Flavoplaca navasiana]
RRNTERIQGSSPPPTPPQNRSHGGFRRPFGSYHSYRPSHSQFDNRRQFASDSYRPSRSQFEARRPFASNESYRQDYAFNEETPPGPGLGRSHDHGQLANEDLDDVTSESEISDAVSANDFTFDGPDADAGETRTENKPTATTFGGRDITTSLTGKNSDRPSPYNTPVDNRNKITAFLHHVRRNHEHSIPTRRGMSLDHVLVSSSTFPRDASSKIEPRVHFLCFPYFSLKPITSDKHVCVADAHHTKTLLQTLFPSTSTQRELQQAVCRISKLSQQSYYYVPQIWCLWSDDDLLITSSQATLEETRREIIEVNTVRPIDSANDAAPAFQVSDKSNRTWLIPLTQCSTWLDFVANFSTLTDDFKADYYVIYCKVIQHPEDWENLVENAKKQKLLQLAIRPRRTHPEPSQQFNDPDSSNSSDEEEPSPNTNDETRSGSPTIAGSTPAQPQNMTGSRSMTLDPEHRIADTDLPNPEGKIKRPKESAKTDNADVQVVGIDEFHLFYWLAAVPIIHTDKISPAIDGREWKQKAAVYLFLNHRRLLQNTNQVQAYLKRKNRIGRRAFAQCPCHSLDDVEALAAESNSESDESERMTRRRILKLSKQLFAFFFPLAHSSRMIGRYWGGVSQFLRYQEASDVVGYREYYCLNLLEIKSKLQPLARILRLGPPPGHISLPIELTRAWIHLLTFWTLVTTHHSQSSRELDKCLNLIEEQDVYHRPYSRGHQEKITSVREEISCVLAVLEAQETLMKRLLSTLSSRRILFTKSDLSRRPEVTILQHCLGKTRDKIQEFDAMDEQAIAMRTFVSPYMSSHPSPPVEYNTDNS